MVLRPIVLDALVGDRAVRLEGLDAVRPAAQRRLQERLPEIAGFPEVLGQHGQLPDDQRQFAVFGFLEREFHRPRPRLLHLGDARVIESVKGIALLAQRIEGPDDVLDGNRLAVVPPGVAVQGEFDPGTVLRPRDRPRQQAVFGAGLFAGVDHERIVKPVAAGTRPPLAAARVESGVAAPRGAPRAATPSRTRVAATVTPAAATPP